VPTPPFYAQQAPSYGYVSPEVVPFPAQAPQQKRPGVSGVRIAVVISLVFLLFAGGGVLCLTNVVSSILHPSVNSDANALSPQDIYTTVTSGRPLIEDTLRTTDLYWGQYVSDRGDGKIFTCM
jgi:hypothetical protein